MSRELITPGMATKGGRERMSVTIFSGIWTRMSVASNFCKLYSMSVVRDAATVVFTKLRRTASAYERYHP